MGLGEGETSSHDNKGCQGKICLFLTGWPICSILKNLKTLIWNFFMEIISDAFTEHEESSLCLGKNHFLGSIEGV